MMLIRSLTLECFSIYQHVTYYINMHIIYNMRGGNLKWNVREFNFLSRPFVRNRGIEKYLCQPHFYRYLHCTPKRSGLHSLSILEIFIALCFLEIFGLVCLQLWISSLSDWGQKIFAITLISIASNEMKLGMQLLKIFNLIYSRRI